LAQKVQNENLNLLCVPSSFQSKQLLIKNNLKITDLECINQNNIDLTIDGADEVDSNLNCIKGGGGCHLQEKIIAYFSKKFVIIADSRKKSVKFGDNWTNGIPIEVLPNAYRMIQEKIESKYGGQALLRESNGTKSKAGPVISDNGNFIVDWIFENNETNGTYDWKTINNFIKMIPGVIETGCLYYLFILKFFFVFNLIKFIVFIEMADMAYFGMQDGNVTIVKKE